MSVKNFITAQLIIPVSYTHLDVYKRQEWWFRATINLVTIDEEAGKEKKIRSNYLVMADDIQEALTRLDESLSFLVVPYVVSSLAVSTIVDVFPYNPADSLIPEGYKPVE